MPKLPNKAKPAPTSNGKKEPEPQQESKPLPKRERPLIYPEIELRRFWTGAEGPITCSLMKKIMGWETEKEYIIRIKKEQAGRKESSIKLRDEDVFIRDFNGEKVACWNNVGNRPIDEAGMKAYAQDYLNRKFVGPTTVQGTKEYVYQGEEPYKMKDGKILKPGDKIALPRGTVNGETFIISRTANVLSGQHRGGGFILACQMWAGKDQARWLSLWPNEPVYETFLIAGVSEDADILRTLDNTIERTEAHVFSTMQELFLASDKPQEKRLLSSMLEKAVDLLWDRTRAGESSDGERSLTHGYRTRSEAVEFLRRHKHLLQFVRKLYALDKERAITLLKLSAGQCSALLYLMASCDSDYAAYYNPKPGEESSEKSLEWSEQKRAEEFWSELKLNSKDMELVRSAIAKLAEEDDAVLGPKTSKKFAILAKAWSCYKGKMPLIAEDLNLEHQERHDGKKVFSDRTDFGGIDRGPKIGKIKEEAAAEEETEQLEEESAEDLRLRKMEEHNERVRAKKGKATATTK